MIDPPLLVGHNHKYNIIFWRNQYYGIPRALGPVDLEKMEISKCPSILIYPSFEKIIEEISCGKFYGFLTEIFSKLRGRPSKKFQYMPGYHLAPKQKILKSIKVGTYSIAFLSRTNAYRQQLGNLPRLLEEAGYSVLYLFMEKCGDEFEFHRTSFQVSEFLVRQLDFINLFIVGNIEYCLPSKPKKIFINHLSYYCYPKAPERVCGPPFQFGMINYFLFDYFILASRSMVGFYDQLLKFLRKIHFSGIEYNIENNCKRMCDKDFDFCLQALSGMRVPKCQYLVPVGYLRFGSDIHQTIGCCVEDIITYAPTTANQAACCTKMSAVKFIECCKINLINLLTHFPNYKIVFKPHPGEKVEIVNAIVQSCKAYSNFIYSQVGSDHADLYRKTAILITDYSATAFTFAFTYLRPVLFFQVDNIDISGQVLKKQENFGRVVKNFSELIPAVNYLLLHREEYAPKLERLRKDEIYHLEDVEEHFLLTIKYILHGEIAEDWICYQ